MRKVTAYAHEEVIPGRSDTNHTSQPSNHMSRKGKKRQVREW